MRGSSITVLQGLEIQQVNGGVIHAAAVYRILEVGANCVSYIASLGAGVTRNMRGASAGTIVSAMVGGAAIFFVTRTIIKSVFSIISSLGAIAIAVVTVDYFLKAAKAATAE